MDARFAGQKPTQRPDSGYNPEAIAQYLNQSSEKIQRELLLAAFALNVPVPWVPRPTPPKLGRPKNRHHPKLVIDLACWQAGPRAEVKNRKHPAMERVTDFQFDRRA
jgi:hypothetical protein